MTDKQSFLDKLNAALVERNISDADIAPYIERFDRFYDRMVSDSVETSNILKDIDSIADNIASQISDRYDEMNRLAERTMTIGAVKIDDADNTIASVPAPPSAAVPTPAPSPLLKDETTSVPIPPSVDVPAPTPIPSVVDVPTPVPVPPSPNTKPVSDKSGDAAIPSDPYNQPTAEADISEISEMVKNTESPSAVYAAPSDGLSAEGSESEVNQPSDEPMRLPDYVEEEPIGDTKLFYIIFFATLPLTVPLALICLTPFVLAWLALGAGIAFTVAALVVAAAAGSLLSAIGIVYGIIRLFDTAAVGLYEIGLGITIGGIVILTCILMYNMAIRLLPYLIKLVFKLLKFVIRKLKELFKYLRKECAKK